MTGIPGLAGTDHVGFTVPDIEAATRFFVDVIGCTVLFEVGPFQSDDDWMNVHLNVHPRAVIRKLRMLKCRNGPAFEIFDYESPDQRTVCRRTATMAAITWRSMSPTWMRRSRIWRRAA